MIASMRSVVRGCRIRAGNLLRKRPAKLGQRPGMTTVSRPRARCWRCRLAHVWQCPAGWPPTGTGCKQGSNSSRQARCGHCGAHTHARKLPDPKFPMWPDPIPRARKTRPVGHANSSGDRRNRPSDDPTSITPNRLLPGCAARSDEKSHCRCGNRHAPATPGRHQQGCVRAATQSGDPSRRLRPCGWHRTVVSSAQSAVRNSCLVCRSRKVPWHSDPLGATR